jgi:hypothetical protein
MQAHAKAASEAPPTSRNSVPGLFGEWIRQGAEGFIATQKILLDLVAQQNALALTMVRERLGALSPSPSNKLVELAGKGFENFMEAQRVLLELAAQQNNIIAEAMRPAIPGDTLKGMAEVVRQGVDTFISAQKKFIDMAETQTHAAIADYREGKKVEGSRLADLARDAMKNFIDSQKRFLDIVEEQMLTKREPGIEAEMKAKRVELVDSAKQGIDAFVEAQKRLLDLAGNQVDVNVTFMREMFAGGEQPRTTSVSEILRKSTDSFVAAQKALVELASKPRKAEQPEPELVEIATH